jgi:large subunit ribosomal protein L2
MLVGSGRNNYGRITSFHRGGGMRKRYRILDPYKIFLNIPAVVRRIEYDPVRKLLLALLLYSNGILTYLPLTKSLNVGDIIVNNDTNNLSPGNALTLAQIPVGFFISMVESYPGSGPVWTRSGGSKTQLLARVGSIAIIKLASGKVRKLSCECKALVGTLAVVPKLILPKFKAGRMRLLGRRPTVRGVAMNPIDHPHGGGEGKSSGGRKASVTPWAHYTKGYKTVRKIKK